MGHRSLRCAASLTLALSVAAGWITPGAAADFKGKTISMVIGSEAGGGSDASGRLMAPLLERYLPGNPQIVVRNMPGAHGMTALNYVVQQTKPDGLTLIAASSAQANPITLKKDKGLYDPMSFAYIGGLGRGGTVVLVNRESEKRLFDRSAQPLFFGVLDGTRSGEQVAVWGIEYLGWNAKWVVGYRGTSAVMLALERGEVDMNTTGNIFHVKRLVDTGKYRILSQSGSLEGDRFVARPEFGDAPVFASLMEGKIADPIAKQAFAYWEAINGLDKWLALAAGTPADIVAAYRAAFDRAVADPDFVTLGKRISEDIAPMSHQSVEYLVAKMSGTTEEAEDFIKNLQRKQGLRVE
ncbi:MAG: Bug family tripartite tricarboxylate transporter substrate binding protein [Gemmatimonas sp.]